MEAHMPGFIDFKELAERVGVEQVLSLHEEIEFKRSGKELRAVLSCGEL
jgi:hypothetical protein